MSTILVTGAAGFIGSHTCDLLLAEGHSVVALDNFSTGTAANLAAAQQHPKFRQETVDVTVPGVLSDCVARARPDAIIHLAGLVSVVQSFAEPSLNFRSNVAATQLVIEAARAHRVPRIVYASSAAVYGNLARLPLTETANARPISPYGTAKLASEALLLGHGAAFGLTVACLRYFNVYGTRQDPRSPYSGVISIFAERLRAGTPPVIFGDGTQTRDFIAVEDVARANLLAATSPLPESLVANICTGVPTSLLGLVALLQRQLGSTTQVQHAPARAGDIRHSRGCPDEARHRLGFTPALDLEAGLARLVRGAAAA